MIHPGDLVQNYHLQSEKKRLFVGSGCVSPGQMQHGLQDVGAIFGAGFTEQRVVGLLEVDRKSFRPSVLAKFYCQKLSHCQVKQSQMTPGSPYHGQLFSIGCRNTVGSVSSQITLVAHEHDGNVLRGHVLPGTLR